MPVISIEKDVDQLSITVLAEFAAPVQRVWDAYMDPRQIERFWGPPTYPAQFLRHDAAVGGRSVYRLVGPEGEAHYGYWEWTLVEAPRRFEVIDGFADESGAPSATLPGMHMSMLFEATDTGTRLTTVSRFDSLDALEQVVSMGVIEGTRTAMAQIDAVLADLADFAASRGTQTQLLSDTQVRVSRVIRGTIDQVWRAHHDADLMRQWLLGPDGWTMPVCEIAAAVGDTYRYLWEPEGGGDGFGFTGELLESEAPYRAVTTEAMIGLDAPATVNELTLTSVEGGTVLSLIITYANREQRDVILATGMTDGMETSYVRLESILAAAAS